MVEAGKLSGTRVSSASSLALETKGVAVTMIVTIPALPKTISMEMIIAMNLGTGKFTAFI